MTTNGSENNALSQSTMFYKCSYMPLYASHFLSSDPFLDDV